MNTKTTRAVLNKKFDHLLSLEKITLKDIKDLGMPERHLLGKIITNKLEQLTGTERDNFLNKIELVMAADMKNIVWERNHMVISEAISNFMRKYGVMPTKNAIADETGLSRQTVSTHFKEYTSHPEFTAQVEQFKFMSHNILANVSKHALNGDMRAAKLYLEMVGAINKQQPGTVINKQNNYIQINNTILSQENLKQLTADQLNQIENIVTNKEYKMLR
jgi:hypothetical protein